MTSSPWSRPWLTTTLSLALLIGLWWACGLTFLPAGLRVLQPGLAEACLFALCLAALYLLPTNLQRQRVWSWLQGPCDGSAIWLAFVAAGFFTGLQFANFAGGYLRSDDFVILTLQEQRSWVDAIFTPYKEHTQPLLHLLFLLLWDQQQGSTFWFNLAAAFQFAALFLAVYAYTAAAQLPRLAYVLTAVLLLAWARWGELTAGFYSQWFVLHVAGLSLLALAACLVAYRTGSRWSLAALAICLFLAGLSDLSASWTFGLVGLCLLLLVMMDRQPIGLAWRRALLPFGIVMGVGLAFVLYQYVVTRLFYHIEETQITGIDPLGSLLSSFVLLASTLGDFVLPYASVFSSGHLVAQLGGVLLCLILLGLTWWRASDLQVAPLKFHLLLLLSAAWFYCLMVSLGRPELSLHASSRYSLAPFLFLSLLAGICLSAVLTSQRVTPRCLSSLGFLVLLALPLPGLIFGARPGWYSNGPIRSETLAIAQENQRLINELRGKILELQATTAPSPLWIPSLDARSSKAVFDWFLIPGHDLSYLLPALALSPQELRLLPPPGKREQTLSPALARALATSPYWQNLYLQPVEARPGTNTYLAKDEAPKRDWEVPPIEESDELVLIRDQQPSGDARYLTLQFPESSAPKGDLHLLVSTPWREDLYLGVIPAAQLQGGQPRTVDLFQFHGVAQSPSLRNLRLRWRKGEATAPKTQTSPKLPF